MTAAFLGAASLASYLYGVYMFGRRYPHRRFGAWRVAAWCAGVTIAVVALLPAVEALVERSFAVHMAQHLLLTLIVPPLLLLGAPVLLLVSLPPVAASRAIARALRHPVMLMAASPVAAWLAFVSVLWIIHFSPLYDLALDSEGVHVVEHVLIVGVSILFWLPIVQVGYTPHPVPFPARVFYVFLAMPQGAFLGLAIYSSRHILYPHYLLGRTVSAALADQQTAGAIMWLGGGALLFLAFMLTGAVWAARAHSGDALA